MGHTGALLELPANLSQLSEMDAAHRKILAMPSGMDGATNARLIEAIKSNSAKARVAGGTPGKPLPFIANSSRQAGTQERAVAGHSRHMRGNEHAFATRADYICQTLSKHPRGIRTDF